MGNLQFWGSVAVPLSDSSARATVVQLHDPPVMVCADPGAVRTNAPNQLITVILAGFPRLYQHPEMTSPPSYSFVKAGMVGLTQYLAVHFAPSGVRVNCLSPGGLYSPKIPKELLENYYRRTPLGRLANCNDIKGAVVFLASDASAYMTGQNLLVDGGCMAL